MKGGWKHEAENKQNIRNRSGARLTQTIIFAFVVTDLRVKIQERESDEAWVTFLVGFPGGSVIICLPMQETQEMRVQSLSWKDPLEEEMASHSSILTLRIPWTEESGGLQPTGSQRIRHD